MNNAQKNNNKSDVVFVCLHLSILTPTLNIVCTWTKIAESNHNVFIAAVRSKKRFEI